MDRTNEMWLAQLQDGHPDQTQAVEDLRRYLKRGILGYLYTRSDLGTRAGAELEQLSEDFAQETLLKIKTNLNSFKGKSKFTTWASKIASNHTIGRLRRARWRDLSLDVLTEAGTSLQEVIADDSHALSHPEAESEKKQVWQNIIAVINNDLTERQRQVIGAVYFEQIPMAEVAHLLGTNTNNVYKILHDARLKLKKQLGLLGFETNYILNLFG